MGLNNSTILAGTTLSAAGGVSKTYTEDGTVVANGKHFIDTSVTDYRVIPGLTVKVRPSVYVRSTKTFTKGLKRATFTIPFVDTTGAIQYPLIRIEIEDHPEMTAAMYTALEERAAQYLFDADFTNFRRYGAMG